ncbi:hypothetical protein FPHYL_7611 [Fusarium phyllophilum]|uniref:Amidohydrolase-related domain-containing protein n=1 Tax=Fusarium phyllophilum TaxID=47803 RepID=A0A8H5N8U4_9HYPO|nr:hypothetical protein FPHYL_7611 [Fusarium phyllophilum]
MRSRDHIPVIDSHIHLFPASETSSLSWYTNDHPLAGQHSVDQYRVATTSELSLVGFIFVETDRKNDLKSGELDGSGWRGRRNELAWIKRIALGRCYETVPPQGSRSSRIGVVKDTFIENMKLLGRCGFTFDVCIDLHRRGQQQIKDLVTFAKLTRDNVPENKKVVLVLDHLCKPDMSDSTSVSGVAFMTWRAAMDELGQDEHNYIKFSGGFSEMGDSVNDLSTNDISKALEKWFRVLLEAFGPRRIMFGSDWPVCTISMSNAWSRWRDVAVQLCQESRLTSEEQGMIFSGTAKQAYNL